MKRDGAMMANTGQNSPDKERIEKLGEKYEELARLFKLVENAKHEWEKSMDGVEDMIILADAEGKVRRVNKTCMSFSGKSYQDILGMDWRRLLADSGIITDSWQEKDFEVFHQPTGRWFVLKAYPSVNAARAASVSRVIAIHDTTELKLKNHELEQAYEQLKATQAKILQQEKMASIGQLAAGVAHEINNPMGFISSNLGTLSKYLGRLTEFILAQSEATATHPSAETRQGLAEKRKDLKLDYVLDDVRKLIAESLDGADRVKTIVQNLKSFSRVDQAEHKHASINECIETTLNIVWNELKYKATVKKEYGDLPLTRCRPQQLNQVFMNLLVNAAHAIEKQGEIAIRTWAESGYIFASVTDTGAGIPKENQARIFEPFFTTKEVGKGTGLGLSIAYDIVKGHNGEISVQSEPGKGATFIVRIPIVEGR